MFPRILQISDPVIRSSVSMDDMEFLQLNYVRISRSTGNSRNKRHMSLSNRVSRGITGVCNAFSEEKLGAVLNRR